MIEQTLIKADIIDKLHVAFPKISVDKLKQLFEDLLETIKKEVEVGREVKISGFGRFISRNKKERQGRNPKTGEVAVISARRVVVFKAGEKLISNIKHLRETML